MQEPYSGAAVRSVHNISLAYFADYRGISDSVRDLCTAGFEAGGINISQSRAEQRDHPDAAEGGPLTNVIGAHSRRWLWKRSMAHDRHRRGADQISGLNPTPPEGANPTCAGFDLQTALSAIHVPSIVIELLLKDVQAKGMFMLVDACGRVQEADSILDRNAGHIRTQYLMVPAS